MATVQDGEDVAHEAWIAAEDPEAERSRSWWSGVVRNRWRMRARTDARRRERERQAAWIDEPSPHDPEQLANRRQVVAVLRECLERLDPTDRTIVVRRHCDGMNARQIGDELGLPPATVRTRLRRALQGLRSDLDQRWRHDSAPWQLAIAPGLSVVPGERVAVTSAGIKLQLALVGIVASAAVGTCVLGRATTMRSEVEPRSAQAPASVGSNPDVAIAQAAWTVRAKALREARARRLLAGSTRTAVDDVDRAADGLRELFFANAGTAAKPTLKAFGEQVSETLEECAQMHTSVSGRLKVRAQLLAEPDIGTIVESVEVREDSVGDPALLECVEESAFTYSFPPPAESLYVAHDFTVDMDVGQVAAAAVLPLEHLPDVLDRYPDFLEALPDVLRQLPGIRAPLRALIDRDPGLAQRLPRFVELVGDAESASRTNPAQP